MVKITTALDVYHKMVSLASMKMLWQKLQKVFLKRLYGRQLRHKTPFSGQLEAILETLGDIQ